MNKRYFKLLFSLMTSIIVLAIMLAVSAPVYAADPQNETDKPKPEDTTKIGKSDLENLLDPKSPNYDPSLRYGREGTRFGPPGKSTTDDILNVEKSSQQDFGLLWTYHNWWGTGLRSASGASKTMATQKVYTSLDLSDSDDVLFAPTLLPTDYSPVEAVVSYEDSPTQRYWKIWHHTPMNTGESFVYATQINASFVNTYCYLGYITTQIVKNGSQWTVYLYDWDNYEWDNMYSVTGSGHEVSGWDMWEEYDLNNDWPDLPEIRSYGLQLYISGSWYSVTSTYGVQISSLPGGFPYDYDWNNQYYDWYVGP